MSQYYDYCCEQCKWHSDGRRGSDIERVVNDAQRQKDFRRLLREKAGTQNAQREPSRFQLDQEEKLARTGAGWAFVNVAKTHEQEPLELIVGLINGGVFQYARANPLKESKKAWKLTLNFMASPSLGNGRKPLCCIARMAPRRGTSWATS